MIAKSMEPFLVGSSVIRAMFEEGKKMAKVFGEENVYDFSVGNPGLHPPKEVKEAINYINNEMDPHVVHGYMANAGYESTRQAVADNLNKRYGSDFDMNNIIMTVGAGSALNVIMKTVFDPGDKQVVFAPYFVEYANWARNYGAETIVVPPNEANGFEPDPEALKAALDPKVKIVIINNPNNPTGAIYSKETIQAIADVLKEAEKEYGHPIYILSDEPYRELVYVDREVPYIPDFYDNTLIAYSWSKSLSLPGERIGYVFVGEKCEMWDEVFNSIVGAAREIGSVCPPTLIQKVIGRCVGEMPNLEAYDENRQLLFNSLSEMGYEMAKPDGAFYMFVKAPNGDAVAFSEKAKLEHNLLVVPGDGFECPGYFRLSYCVSNDMIKRSLPAFKAMIESYK